MQAPRMVLPPRLTATPKAFNQNLSTPTTAHDGRQARAFAQQEVNLRKRGNAIGMASPYFLDSQQATPLDVTAVSGDVEMTKLLLSVVILCAAMATVVINTGTSHAQDVQQYHYCALDHGGGTVCYFNSRDACAKAGSGRCIENPFYLGSDAMASEPF